MRRSALRSSSFLNLAPMIDVLTVLLIFLILTFVVDQQNQEVAETVSLPETISQTKNFPAFKISIDQDSYLLEQKKFEDLESLKAYVTSEKISPRPVLISVDQRLPYSRVEQVIRTLTASGFTEFHFLAEQKEKLD